jgi:hypothetical protein
MAVAVATVHVAVAVAVAVQTLAMTVVIPRVHIIAERRWIRHPHRTTDFFGIIIIATRNDNIALVQVG